MKFGDFLRLERAKKGDIPLHSIATKAGLSPSILNRYETGINKTPPTPEILKKMSKGYEVSEAVLLSILYGLELEDHSKKSKDKAKEALKVPVVPEDLAVKMILEQSVANEHTSVNWVFIQNNEAYCCGFEVTHQDYAPLILKGDIVIVKTVSVYKHQDLIALATPDMKRIEIMVLSEYENQLFLRGVNPLIGQVEIPVTIHVKKRMLGVVEKIQRSFNL